MAVARKHRTSHGPAAEETPKKRTGPRRVKEGDAPVDARNPVAEHLFRLEDAFSQDPAERLPRYPGPVRLAILIGAPAVAWAAIAAAVIGLRALF
jgi:hypothetical protein